jgi:branched-chain amino acid transport system substrate-binding protein
MKIALLLPRSVIYPSMSFDMMDGFKQALKNIGLECHHEIVSVVVFVPVISPKS